PRKLLWRSAQRRKGLVGQSHFNRCHVIPVPLRLPTSTKAIMVDRLDVMVLLSSSSTEEHDGGNPSGVPACHTAARISHDATRYPHRACAHVLVSREAVD